MQRKNGGLLLLVEYIGVVVLWLLKSKKAREATRNAETRRLAFGSVIVSLAVGVLATTLTSVNGWIVLLVVLSIPMAVFLLKTLRKKLEEDA